MHGLQGFEITALVPMAPTAGAGVVGAASQALSRSWLDFTALVG